MVGGIALGASILFGLESKFGGRLDERTRQRITAAEHQRDTAIAVTVRQGQIIDSIRAARTADSARQRELVNSITRINTTVGRLQADVRGVIRFLPTPGSSDTAEIVGPRTDSLIRDQQATIVNLRSSSQRDSLDIERLFSATDSLRGANRSLDSAYQGIKSAFETVSKQRYGWKDRITASVCYEPIQFAGSHVGGGACFTVARPLRLLDRLPTWLGGVR